MNQFIATMLSSFAPLALAGLAGMIAYRSGVVHLGLEGLVLIGAFTGVAVSAGTGNVLVGTVAAVAASVAMSALFWLMIGPLKANQFIAGLGITLLGGGGTAFLLEALYGSRGAISAGTALPRPLGGTDGPLEALGQASVLTWMTPLFVAAIWVLLRRTTYGLRLAAAGEFPFAMRAIGVEPWTLRLHALLLGGVFAGLAGVELSLGGLSSFTPNMANGRGYIAFVAVVLGAGHPLGVAAACLFFGLVDAIGVQSQLSFGGSIPSEAILALPYLLTIVAIVASARLRRQGTSAGGFGELRAD